MMNEIEKVFFAPGDLVVLRHKDLESPVMYVVEKVSKTYKQGGEMMSIFKGIKCRWFDKNSVLQEAVFSSKDLTFYK